MKKHTRTEVQRVRKSADTEAVMDLVGRAGTGPYPDLAKLNLLADCALRSGMSEDDFGRLACGAWRRSRRERERGRAKATSQAATPAPEVPR